MLTLMKDFCENTFFTSRKFKGVFFEFGLNYLLDQPKEILPYAQSYFEKKATKPKLVLIQDYTQRDSEANDPYANYSEEEIKELVFSQTHIFACLPKDVIEKIKSHAKRKKVERGEIIIMQNEQYDYFYVIEKGIFKAYISAVPDKLGK